MNKDIFDRLMSLPVLRIFEPFYRRHKEVLLYLLFGFLSFVVSIATFALFCQALHLNELIANVLSWIITVLFAFLTNRVWVFGAKTGSAAAFLRQMFAFFEGRLLTLGIEELILFLFITWLRLNSIAVKVVAQIVVILLNYIISKRFIFRNKTN